MYACYSIELNSKYIGSLRSDRTAKQLNSQPKQPNKMEFSFFTEFMRSQANQLHKTWGAIIQTHINGKLKINSQSLLLCFEADCAEANPNS